MPWRINFLFRCVRYIGSLSEKTGLTPQRYLNRLRLMKARHLLRHSEASVTDIAYRCGFSDSNHFSTLFRREFNWSPRDIRQGRDGFSAITRIFSTYLYAILRIINFVLWPR